MKSISVALRAITELKCDRIESELTLQKERRVPESNIKAQMLFVTQMLVNKDHRKTAEELYQLSSEERLDCLINLLDDMAEHRQIAEDLADDTIAREEWILAHLEEHPSDAQYFNKMTQLAPNVSSTLKITKTMTY